MILVLFALCAPAGGSLGPNTPSANADIGLWTQADAMVNRLREERRKLKLIFEELERLQFMGQDFRDLQLYPTRVTKLGPDDDVRLDRMIDALEKKLAATRKQVIELEKPLDDAYFIAKEMLQETPNQDMVDLLLKDNVDRIGRLVLVQKELNKRWEDAFALLAEYRERIGLRKAGRDGGLIEDDFFKVLMANVGRASQRFYGEMNDYKDSLAARTNKQEWERMANLDLKRIKVRLSSKSIEMVQEDLERLSVRFQGRISIGIVNYYLGASFMVGGKPLKAVEAFAKVSTDSRMYGPAALGVLQALFDSRQDDSLVVHYKAYMTAGVFDAKLFPSARYLVVQSAYVLGMDSIVETEMTAGGNKNKFHFKSLFVYAKSLVRQKRFPEARGVLITLVRESQIDKRLQNQAALALAHLNFEEAHYEQALKGYQNLLDQSGFQAEALYGMVWSNIRMGDLDAGEFILKKLIAQYPDNPWAIEGFNVLVRKVMIKAKNEWTFRIQVDKQADQLKEFNKKLLDRESGKLMSEEQLAAIKAKLAKATAALERQKPLSPESIARLYQQGLGLVEFVEERYKSGEYSEETYNQEREAVLAKLIDLGLAGGKAMASADSAAADSVGFRKQVKLKLFESRALGLEIHVMHKAWLEELLKYTQRSLNQELAAIRNDTAKAALRAELSKRSRVLADDISERLAGKSDDILRRIRELTENPNSAGIMDWLLFQKGFLNYGLEEDALKKRMASFQWLEAQAGGRLPIGQSEPTLDPQNFEAPWMELIEKFPQSPWRPAALYYLGYTQTLRGETVSGLRYFEELAERFPQSLYAQQALIFIGEYYFNENKLDKAAEAYDKVLDFADSKYFEQALYKLAWTRYRANAYKTAISSFTFILEESGRKSKSNSAAKSVLTSEALQFAALAIAESDTSGDGGLNQSKAFADKLGDSRLGAKLLHRMAVIYTQAGKMDRSKRAMEALMNDYKDYEKMPEAIMELGRAYEKEQNYQKAAEVREKIFRIYSRNSNWYTKVASSEAKRNADTVSEVAIELVARHYLYEAKQLATATGAQAATRDSYLRKAISAYDAFLAIYPENPNKAKYNYQQAEAYYSLEEFEAATKKYISVSKMGDPKLKKMAAYNAIVAAQEMLKKAEDAKK
ncbi:MAG: tetratricopeptide repeat protein [Fibrobacterota bacterium]|nr:tetratricopeptide repeat protein [Fibrobacterota bacterium]